MDETAVMAGAVGGAGREPSDPGRPVGKVAELLLLALPSAHLLYLPAGGAMATGADLLVLFLLLAWVVDLVDGGGVSRAVVRVLRGGEEPGLPGRGFFLGGGLLALFGIWVAASGTWGFHPIYAGAKGVGTVSLALAALALASSGITWERAVDAWLGGVALALLLTVGFALLGPAVMQERVLYDQGGILGLPFQRVSGPLLHPNMLGDFLVVSGCLLWGRWEALSPQRSVWMGILAVAMGIALFLSASTAWVSAGIAAAWLARWSARHGHDEDEDTSAVLPPPPAEGSAGGSRGPWWVPVVRLAGTAAAAATLVALVLPLDLTLGPLSVTTGGIRPDIWSSAVSAVLESPLVGVGAAPYLAEAVDPMAPAVGPVLWDAHNAYLSVVGQFGLIGGALLGAGLFLVARAGLAGVEDDRIRFALAMALVAVAVNAVFMASEDLRHVWILLGLVGVGGSVEE